MTFSYRIEWLPFPLWLLFLLPTTACELQSKPLPDADASGGMAGEGGFGGATDSAGHGGTGAVGGTGSGGMGGQPCTDSSQCPDPMNECLVATCDGGNCSIATIANNTPTIEGQLDGDCKLRVCNGAGSVAFVNDDNDPADDLNDCTADTCNGGNHVFTPIAGTCAQNGGKTCGDPAGPQSGQCVKCNVDADCTTAGYVCDLAGGTNTCVPSTCSDGAKNGNETGIDCGGDVCRGCIDAPCQTRNDCQSGFCSANVCAPCTSHLDCDIGDHCDPTTYGGACVTDKPSGSTCDVVEECQSGNCTSGVCCNGSCSPCTGMIGLPHAPGRRFVARIGDELGDTAVGDLNGDGFPDVAVIESSGTDRVRLLYNQGNGQFAQEGELEIDSTAGALAIADFNANGALDVAVLNTFKDVVTVFYNLGNGLFAPGINYATPADPTALVIANINGDALPDIVTTHFNGIGILLNQGNQLFGAAATVAVDNAVAAADLNGDGLDDIVSIIFDLNTKISVRMNQGNATFAAPVDSLAGEYPDHLEVGDLNGDGLPDIVLGRLNDFDVMLNQGNDTLAALITYPVGFAMSDLAIADVDADNLLDVVAIRYDNQYGNVSVLRNQGNGVLTPAVDQASIPGDSIRAADFDQDGKTDLAVLGFHWTWWRRNDFEVLFNLGNGTYASHVDAYSTAASVYNLGIVAADLSGDSVPDIATSAGVFVNQGNGVMANELTYPGNARFQGLTAADFDADGTLDLAGISDDYLGQLKIMYNQGGATFGAPTPALWTAPDTWVSVPVAADFNGDNLSDIAIGSETIVAQEPITTFSKYTLHVFVNQGNNAFVESEFVIDQGVFWGLSIPLAVADFNGDGHVDLAYGTRQSMTIEILLNQGNAIFAKTSSVPVNSGICAQALAVADINGDGFPDISTCGVRLNQGNGSFGSPIGTDEASALIDLSGDGVPDLVKLTHLLSMQRNVGGGVFGPEARYVTGGLGPAGIASADFNGDGKLDLAVMNGYSSSVSSAGLSILLNECLP